MAGCHAKFAGGRVDAVPAMRTVQKTVVTGLLVVLAAACTESSETPDASAPAAGPGQTHSDPVTVVPASGVDPFPMDATIAELQRAMRTGRITAVELVDFYLARIEAYDDAGPALSAILAVNPDARDEAAALDAERAASGPRGPLHGIPVVVKDNIDTSQMPTTGGALALEDFRPARDAFQIRRLREAGAIIIAKANLAELAGSWQTYSPVGGQTLNPYDTTRGPGGSSGGTAAAVTANFAVAGLGTDTCGSNRLPAGVTNLYGLRPTSGLSSRAGVIPFSSSLDEVGPMARTIRDLALVLDATAGEDPADPTTVPLTTSFVDAVDADGLEGRRIGILQPNLTGDSFNYRRAMDGIVQTALDTMVDNGAELVEVTVPGDPHGVLVEFLNESPSALARYLAAEPTAPAGALDALTDPGANVEPPHSRAYRHALATRESFRRSLEAVMDEHDLDAIAYPDAPTTARPIVPPGSGGETEHWECGAAAVAGVPALAVPVGFASDGLPVGMELMGRPFDEATLISIAAGYEARTDHRRLPPTTPPLDIEP
jgi:Asp-tRNA(Asn)/Glu-tRNA(Gln) amidotransferase A subunit family amidase